MDIEVGEIFTLVDENEEEQEVEVLGTMDIDGTDYIAVTYVQEMDENSEEDIDVFFFRVDNDGELSAIESDDEFNKVAEAFESALDEEHDCDDPTHHHHD
jgi:uncharacterized protein YrzB (UPF0473 family)